MTDPTRDFFHTLPGNILRSFRGRNLLWHILAIGATAGIVVSDFDWTYFEATRPFAGILFPAVILGWLAPLIFPILAYLAGSVFKDRRVVCGAFATAQAALIGLLVSSFYKALTGRPGPWHSALVLIDSSREFHFGFLKGGIYQGWPSSHTTVAFAMTAAIWTFFPGGKLMRGVAFLYALYVGVGVSMTIHSFSDFVAGAIIGAVIGILSGTPSRIIWPLRSDASRRLLTVVRLTSRT